MGSFLPKNYYAALAQFKVLEKRLDKESDFRSKYNEEKNGFESCVISVKLSHRMWKLFSTPNSSTNS